MLDAARAGTFRMDLDTRELRWSQSMSRLLGVESEDAPGTFDDFLALVHPDDRAELDASIGETLAGGPAAGLDLRVVWPDGSEHWLHGETRLLHDEEGRPRTLVGMARDISAERVARAESDAASALVDAIFLTAPVGLAFVDTDLRYVRMNDALARIQGRPMEEVLGRRPTEVLPADLGARVEAAAADARDSGEVVWEIDLSGRFEDTPLERFFTDTYYPVPGPDGRCIGVGIVVSETTDRVQSERSRERALERTRFLADVSAVLDASLDYDRTLSSLADLAVRRIADWCSIDMVDAEAGLRNVAVAHVDPEKLALAQELQRRYPPDLDAPTGAAHVALRSGEPELYAEITPELLERGGVDEEQVELIRSLGLSSAMVVPLRARGRVLGALSLVAGHGRPPYGPDDLAFAQDIAARAALAVDNARLYQEARLQERRSTEARAILDTLIDAAPIGVAFFDRDARYVRVNEALAELHGIPVAEHLGLRLDEVMPELVDTVLPHIEEVVRTNRPVVDVEVTAPAPEEPGGLRHYLASYYPVPLPGGEALGVGATVLDMTARITASQELRGQRDLYETLLRAQSELGEAFALVDGQRIVYVNEATERLSGRSAAELYALESLFDLLPEDQHRPVAARLRAIRAGVEQAEPGFPTEILRPDGTRVPIEAAGHPLPGEETERLVMIARDITERRHQEAERERLLHTEQAARRASEAAHARVRLLADASAMLERSMSDEEALQDVAELLVARLGDSCVIDVLGRDGRLRRLGAASRAEDARGLLLSLAEGDRLDPAGDHPIAQALRTQQPGFFDDAPARFMRDVAGDAEALDRLADAIGRSLTLVPLVARGRSVGTVTLGWRAAGRQPSRDEWSLIEALAQRIALAVDSAMQYQERAYVARTLQRSLLPGALPQVPGAEIAAEYVAAGEGMEVGGDFYDVFAVGEEDEWAIVVGDVCGKGAEAAAVTALARYTLRAVTTRSPSPAAALATLNEEMLRQMPEPRFLTAILGRLVVAPDGGGRLTLASGGHLPPVVLRAGGTPEVPECQGMLVGVEPDARSIDCRIDLAPGDAIVLYTDGITEARADRPMPATELADALQPVLADGAAAIARRAVEVASERAGGRRRDDVAVLVLRLTER
ncbi:MAG: hypothetical protein QOF29_898 [bacterium]